LVVRLRAAGEGDPRSFFVVVRRFEEWRAGRKELAAKPAPVE
jgi:hypothetical protein